MNEPIEFNAGQLEALEQILAWYNAYRAKQTTQQLFFLTGDAGTGKTSIARHAAMQCVQSEFAIVYIAPTGKAASVLRKKGCTRAKTLHQFAYNLAGEDENGDPLFYEKGVLDERPLLVVLDEGSMVGEDQMNAVLRHSIPVLVLGDLSQIPPVKASPFLTPEHVDYALTEIVRQCADSNIIRASQFVKNGKRLPPREYEDVKVRTGEPPFEALMDHVGENAQILCAKNKTRDGINARIRRALGHVGAVPEPGEKIMCWFNQHQHNFMNGEQGIVIRYEPLAEYEMFAEFPNLRYVVLRSLTDGRERRVKFNPDSFSDDPEVRKTAQKNIGGFDYGYCVTIHKSQGSEWERVLVIEEFIGNDYARLFYTAITRATRELTFYRKN